MELGDLESAVLKAVRHLKEATPGEIFRVVLEERDVAYTSVTTTIYRLVEKGLLAARRVSEKKVFYSLKSGPGYRKTVGGMMDRLLGAFGPAAVAHLLEHSDSLTEEEREALRSAISRERGGEDNDDS